MSTEDPLLPLVRLPRAEQGPWLEAHYAHCNRKSYRSSDPVEFLWRFDARADREVMAWLAAGLAYGRVASIRASLEELLQRWEGQPAAFLFQSSESEIRKAHQGFQYRWTREQHVTSLLIAWKRFIEGGGDAVEMLRQHQEPGPGGMRSGFVALRSVLVGLAPEEIGHLLPAGDSGGACKRPAMMLRWLLRKDEIDPGDWSELGCDGLWIPLDVHMFRIAKRLRLTRRKQPDALASQRITESLARICPYDPVRYDFCLTRIGMGV